MTYKYFHLAYGLTVITNRPLEVGFCVIIINSFKYSEETLRLSDKFNTEYVLKQQVISKVRILLLLLIITI